MINIGQIIDSRTRATSRCAVCVLDVEANICNELVLALRWGQRFRLYGTLLVYDLRDDYNTIFENK